MRKAKDLIQKGYRLVRILNYTDKVLLNTKIEEFKSKGFSVIPLKLKCGDCYGVFKR